MLSIAATKGGRFKAVLGIILPALLASCGSSNSDEKTFSLYLNGKSYSELVQTLKLYSTKNGYTIARETLPGNRAETTAQHIMLEGGGMRVLLQNALAEQCKEREGRRNVEYSLKVFDVNAFPTSYLKASPEISRQVEQLKKELDDSGFRTIPKSESCNLL